MRNHRAAIAAALAASLSACGLGDDLLVVRGNRLFGSGRVHEAAAMYLRAGAGAEPVASYDLANAFLELGEEGPAAAMYGAAAESGGPEVSARAWYNRGVSSWKVSDYGEAAASFRKGLEAYLGRDGHGGRDSPSGGAGARFVFELSRAYELALAAAERKKEAGQMERGAYSSTEVDAEAKALALSRFEERSLFLPGKPDDAGGVDH